MTCLLNTIFSGFKTLLTELSRLYIILMNIFNKGFDKYLFFLSTNIFIEDIF